MPSKLKRAIRAVKDQTSISIAKVSSNTSSSLEVPILKATTHDDVPIDEKYVNEILRLVCSNKAQASACARALAKRIGRTRNWIVALKSLMLILRIFQDGDPYFPREVLHAMKRGAKILNLSSFRDDSNSSPWDFTAFVRTFALYLDERLECFLTGKLRRRRSGRESEGKTYERSKSRDARLSNEKVGDMKPAMLLDKIAYWQRLLDRAIATRPTGVARTNRLVLISLYAVVQESFELYKDISEGLTHLLDSFFHLQYQNCVTAFQTCVKAAKQFEELGAFYTLCKSIGVGRNSEYPSIRAISEELIDTLQEFLKDQSSFSSNMEPQSQHKLLPAPPASVVSQSSMNESKRSEFSIMSDAQSELTSEFGSVSTSLEDLISATETSKSRAISIDLEEYPTPQTAQDFKLNHAGSTKSLPITNSMNDLVSLDDSSGDDNEQHEQPQQEQKPSGLLESQASKTWELMLLETLSASATLPDNNPNTFNAFPSTTLPDNDEFNNTDTFNAFPSTSLPDNNTNTFDAFPSTSLPDNNTNTFNAFPEHAPDESTTGSELVLFQPPTSQQPVGRSYNPFLQDMDELPDIPAPTFQASPTFSAQNQSSFPVQNDTDPFADAFASDDQAFGSSVNEQNVLQQQELWLRNQNKIIAKLL